MLKTNFLEKIFYDYIMALNMKSILEKFDSEELKKLDGIKNREFF
jgi:hypothetical protein